MNLRVDIDSASAEPAPEEEDLRSWIRAALTSRQQDTEISVRLVDIEEMCQLNKTYRGKSGATNVLSFPYEGMPGVTSDLLGDVVVCAPVVANESVAQHKTLEAHWAHIVVHGVLHLLGHDHTHDDEAHKMEACETGLLAGLGYPDPYE